MLDLRGADAEGQCADCAVRRGMGIPADNDHSGLSDA